MSGVRNRSSAFGITIIALFCLAKPVQSQDSLFWNKTDFVIGLGVNYPAFSTQKNVYSGNVSPAFRIGAIRQFWGKASLFGGLGTHSLSYSRQGQDSNETFLQTIRENYIELPLFLAFHPSGNRQFSLYAGISPSILITKNISRKELYPPMPPPGNDPSSTGRFDMMLSAGLGMRLLPNVQLGLEYHHSLTSEPNFSYNPGRFSNVQVNVLYVLNPGRKEEKRPVQKTVSQKYFNTRNLTVLVRLKTESRKIERLRANGYEEDARHMETQVAIENKNTMEAFQEVTGYPVYFFLDTSSAWLVEKQLKGILFDGESNVIDLNRIDTSNFLIAEFGSPHSDAFNTSSGFGLVVYDRNFNQMKEPFPYYVSNFYGVLSRQEVVSRFNERFQKFIQNYALTE